MKLPNIDLHLDNHATDLLKINKLLIDVEHKKMDNNKYEEILGQIRELKKLNKEIESNGSSNLQKDLQELKVNYENLKNNHDLFLKFTNDSVYALKENVKFKTSVNDFEQFKKSTEDEFLSLNEDLNEQLELKADKTLLQLLLSKNKEDMMSKTLTNLNDAIMCTKKPNKAPICGSCENYINPNLKTPD